MQPLTLEQTTHYLIQAGAPLAGVRAALQNDESLWELLDTPLMLSVAALAYYGRSAKEIVLTGTSEERKSQLFAKYTEAMFSRRGKALLYSRQKTIQWLAWLAYTLANHNQSVFYVEWMQPNWLSSKWQQWLVNLGAVVLSGLSGALICGLLYGVSGVWDKIVVVTREVSPFFMVTIHVDISDFPECPSCVLNFALSKG